MHQTKKRWEELFSTPQINPARTLVNSGRRAAQGGKRGGGSRTISIPSQEERLVLNQIRCCCTSYANANQPRKNSCAKPTKD
jgi:hypothetical protein